MSISTLESPLTALEQSRMEPPTWTEIQEAIGEASSDFDDGELGDVCAIAFEQIAELISAKDAQALGSYVMFLRRQRIADIASRRIYGRVGEILASGVNV